MDIIKFNCATRKYNHKSCSNYKLISIVSHRLKAFLRVIHGRLLEKC